MKLLVALMLFSATAQGAMQSLSFSLQEIESKPIELYSFSASEAGPSKGIAKKLYTMKKLERQRNYQSCYSVGQTLIGVSRGLDPWVRLRQLICATELLKTKGQSGPIQSVLDVLKKHHDWMSGNSYSSDLQKWYVRGRIEALKFFSKKDRTKVWQIYDDINANIDWLNNEQKADVYSVLGQTAFIQQELEKARIFYMRSLDLEDSATVRDRLSTIQAKLNIPVEKSSLTVRRNNKMLN
ncbi:MAG: hypothetical protein R2827_06740 [Bdellovibrionales bacterium]